MPDNSATLHEARQELSQATVERHRAIASLMEELEAVDWYDQRVDATQDEHLKAILAHNRDEEKEHAVMTLEWLRRNDPRLDAMLRQYLFTDPRDVTEVEDEAEAEGVGDAEGGGAAPADSRPADGSLGIGSLKSSRGGAA